MNEVISSIGFLIILTLIVIIIYNISNDSSSGLFYSSNTLLRDKEHSLIKIRRLQQKLNNDDLTRYERRVIRLAIARELIRYKNHTNTLSDNDITLSSTLDNILLGDYSNLDIDDETHRRLRVLLAHDDFARLGFDSDYLLSDLYSPDSSTYMQNERKQHKHGNFGWHPVSRDHGPSFNLPGHSTIKPQRHRHVGGRSEDHEGSTRDWHQHSYMLNPSPVPNDSPPSVTPPSETPPATPPAGET